MTRNGNYV